MTADDTGGGGGSELHPIVTRLLKEQHQLGHSPTLEAWLAQTRQRLESFSATATSAKLRKDAQQIERGYELAAQLIEHLLAESVATNATDTNHD